MNNGDLKKQIQNIPDDADVFLRCCLNPCGNIVEAKFANIDTRGSFGKSINCIIIEPDIDEQFIQ